MADKCGANTRAGKPCQNTAGFKTDHVGVGQCHLHGGKTRNGIKHAQKLEAQNAVARLTLPIDVSPEQALLEELARTNGALQFCESMIEEIEPGALVYGLRDHRQGFGPEGPVDVKTFSAAANIWVEMWQTERKHYVVVAAACLKAGIEERRTQLAEAQGRMIVDVLRGVLRDHGVTEPDPAIVRKHLSLVSSVA